MNVAVEPAGAAAAPVIANLMELYLHDFSELGGPPIGEDGRYSYPYLEEYWTTSGRYAFLIRVDGALAGFALVADRAILERGEVGHEITEFFVLRGYRRHRVGEAAAAALFARFPGRWWVGELDTNPTAIAFWRMVVGRVTGGRYEEETWVRDGQGRGVVQRFAV